MWYARLVHLISLYRDRKDDAGGGLPVVWSGRWDIFGSFSWSMVSIQPTTGQSVLCALPFFGGR